MSILTAVFSQKKPIIAGWFSGALIVPYGQMVTYVHMGYGSEYENYQILRVKEGLIAEHLRMSHTDFQSYKKMKFDIFKQTERFRNEFEKLTVGEYDWADDQTLDFLQSYYAEYYLSL